MYGISMTTLKYIVYLMRNIPELTIFTMIRIVIVFLQELIVNIQKLIYKQEI